MLGIYFLLSDEKQLYYRRVYSIFEFLEDFGGILGSFQLIFTPLATYSSILMTNYLLNNNFVFEHKSEKSVSEMLSNMESRTNELTRLKQFRYTFCRYICSKITNASIDDRFLELRRKGEERIE